MTTCAVARGHEMIRRSEGFAAEYWGSSPMGRRRLSGVSAVPLDSMMGCALTAPCVCLDVSTMQSVRHTPTCIPFGGWCVQGVEIAWPVMSGASSQLFPVGISSSCQCKRIFSMGITVGTAQDQVWHFLGPNGAAAQCLTGQTTSVR